MPVLAVASVKASPGVTTAALAVAAGWPGRGRAVVAECDPAGGDVAAWFGLAATPGLVSLAAAARRDPTAGRLAEHCQRLPGGVEVLAGPPGAAQATAALQVLAGQRMAALTAPATGDTVGGGLAVMVADCGRLTPGSPAVAVLNAARLTVLVIRPVLAEVSHLAAAVDAVRQVTRSLVLVVVGEDGYTSDDLAVALEVPVVGRLPRDPGGARLVTGQGVVSVRRSRLAQAARVLAVELARHLTVDPIGPAALTAGPTTVAAATHTGVSIMVDGAAVPVDGSDGGTAEAGPARSDRRRRRARDPGPAVPPGSSAGRTPGPGWVPSMEADR
ncbi:hypothetical protein [Frankia sp. CiP3]|uniref:hypothetical protein n=1 Tax=Frankia sp. CiP3 TaxID=2880971 RepID=UPI001EF65381|nr:hypothetical protein [Frankia sp. CiP3]